MIVQVRILIKVVESSVDESDESDESDGGHWLNTPIREAKGLSQTFYTHRCFEDVRIPFDSVLPLSFYTYTGVWACGCLFIRVSGYTGVWVDGCLDIRVYGICVYHVVMATANNHWNSCI